MSKIKIKTPEEIELLKAACKITSQILTAVGDIVKPGINTEDINTFVHKMTLDLGATPATLNYKGFPKSVCTSPNEVVCHGIPSKSVILKEGDILNVDVTSIKDGFFGDSSRMYFVGGRETASKEVQTLVDVAKQSLNAAIKIVKPGAKFGDIGAAIEKYISKQDHRYGIVREYTGHGIGSSFHEPPQVLHVGKKGTGPTMRSGMTFTIEPMINMGTWRTVLSKIDEWTVRTLDGKLSAQWEHTVLVTRDGAEILTEY